MTSKNLAGGSLITALTLLFIAASALSTFTDLALMTLASLCLAVTLIRYGYKTAILSFLASALISSFWPGLFFSLSFLVFFGPWPLLKAYWEQKSERELHQASPATKNMSYVNQANDFRFLVCIVAGKQVTMSFLLFLLFLLNLGLMQLNLVEIIGFLEQFRMSPLLQHNTMPLPLAWLIIFLLLQLILFAYDNALTILISWYLKYIHRRF